VIRKGQRDQFRSGKPAPDMTKDDAVVEDRAVG
jgi:hypothetical protein